MLTPDSTSEARRSETAEGLLFVVKRMKEVQQPSAAVIVRLRMHERVCAKMQMFDAPPEVRIS